MLKNILNRGSQKPALVIGNGINRYNSSGTSDSWDELLVKLAKRHLTPKFQKIPQGLSLTEFYELLDLKSRHPREKVKLQSEFCELMTDWSYAEHHKNIVEWSKRNSAPILTTNFESTLADAGGCTLHRTVKQGFTYFYPWESYYGVQNIFETHREFGIWHINGMERYSKSIRLGLTHYMGSVQRARKWIHEENEKIQFSGKDTSHWRGANSWLHIVFNSPLIFIGLGLEDNEVFLRWLLIERARYFKRFSNRKKDAWFVQVGDMKNKGKQYFLEGVGVKILNVDSYDDIYAPPVWET